MLSYPDIDPIALALGPIKIHWYGITYVVGLVTAWLMLRWRAKKNPLLGWTKEHIDDVVFFATLGVIIGGRLGSVLFYNLPQYLEHPLDVFKIWQGGMSFHGGLLGVLVAMIWFARKTNASFVNVIDFIAPVVPIGLGCGRIGNFINGELWGAPSSVPWAMIFPSQYAGGIPRHPTQLYEALLEGLLLFIILWFYSAKPRPKMAVSGLFLFAYGVFRFGVEFVREPDAHLGYLAFDWVTMGQVLSFPMILVGIVMLVFAKKPQVIGEK